MNNNELNEEKTNEIIQSLKALSQKEKNTLFRVSTNTPPLLRGERMAMIFLLAGADPHAEILSLCTLVINKQFSVLDLAFSLGFKPSMEELDQLILAAVRSDDRDYFKKLYDMKESRHKVPDLFNVAVNSMNFRIVFNAKKFHASQEELDDALDEATLLADNFFAKIFSFSLLKQGAKFKNSYFLLKELSLKDYRFVRALLKKKYIECDSLYSCDILMEACKGRCTLLKELLNYGYKDYVNSLNEQSQSPLEIAVIYNNYKAVKILLEYGADPVHFENDPIMREVILKSSKKIRKIFGFL